MDTTFKTLTSKHNIHFVKCEDSESDLTAIKHD